MKKVIILIDGQNLYYNLKEIGLKESHIKWSDFFSSLTEEGDELIRTYWFRPQKIHDANFTRKYFIARLLSRKNRSLVQKYFKDPDSINSEIRSDVEAAADKAMKWLQSRKESFNQIEYSYDQIGLEHHDIEVVKTGILKVDPLKEIYIGEKGVDISLAVKMIELTVNGSCGKIILISGDYDYVEAIKFVKNKMMKVHIVKVHRGYPPKNKSMSRDLSILSDRLINVYESDLRDKFLIPGHTGSRSVKKSKSRSVTQPA